MAILFNESHPRQDIHRRREFDESRVRYRFASKLLPQSPTGHRLLDVGGGAGEFTSIARQLGFVTTLVDGNERSVEAERQKGHHAVRADLNAGLGHFADGVFDIVVCLDVIEHIVAAEYLLKEMARVLRPGGHLLLSTPNFAFVLDRLKYVGGGDAREEGYHFRFFTEAKLSRMVSDAGLLLEGRNSVASGIGLNFILRIISAGKLRLRQFRCPPRLESWLASTFVWRMTKPEGLC